MGGTKKKTLASMEKSQEEDAADASKAGGKKKTAAKETKGPGERRRVEVLMPRMSDQDLMKSLHQSKAITIYSAARSLNVNASVARAIMASLEAKGLVRRIGGFSGHYVWSPMSKS